jgi:selenocysteine lyase/cysteine desulfurase
MARSDASPRRRYLDNAATSWPKPECVWDAWQRAARENGVAPGRGGYREALDADRLRDDARGAAARLVGCGNISRIALPATATLGLNMAIHGLVSPGDHVIATAADHNATLRPLHALATSGTIRLTVVSCDAMGVVDPAAIQAALAGDTRWVVLSHASNVTGGVQDVVAIAAIARAAGAGVILDASQTLGVVPVDVDALGVDCLVAPAHKWLLGMPGLAVLFLREGVEPRGIIQGGTGTGSESLEMPRSVCERFEPGTPDLPALAAFASAARWRESDRGAAASRSRSLAAGLAESLGRVPGVRVVAARLGPPIVSFTLEGYAPAEVAAVVEEIAGVQVRSGFHCAALVHARLGTPEGTVRASVGPFNTVEDCDALLEAVDRLASSRS